jgi:hypothetical protein
MEIWQGYSGRSRTLLGYDLAGTGDPVTLTQDEVKRTRIIASRVTNEECARFLKRARNAPWGDVSTDSDLACADPAWRGGIFDKAAALYWHFTAPHEVGIGPAMVHKVLHLKRPLLYPVLDRLVRRLYRTQAKAWVNELPDTRPGDSVTFWAAIRADLVDLGNSSALSLYRDTFRTTPETASMADLPLLRLLDIVAWETARKEFGR